jgi:hypothetical protein
MIAAASLTAKVLPTSVAYSEAIYLVKSGGNKWTAKEERSIGKERVDGSE